MSIWLGRGFLSTFLTTLFILIFSTFAFAQDLDNVTISGKITDSNNAPIVGANVTATLTQTGKERSVITDEEGRFNLLKLEPGTYTVKFSANGFGAKEQKDLVTVAGQNVQLNISLAPAGVTAEQTITIDGDDAPPVDTTRTVVGGTITQREIEEIPINSRSPLDLVLTLGGTSEESLSTKDLAEDKNASVAPLEQGNFSLSGGTAYSNNLTIDGLDNNDDRSSRERFQPSLESIAEVQVISNQFSAEYGRASGGRVNLRTRAGGNKFRGRIFGFYRNDNLNANTWYNNSRNIIRPEMINVNPGFTFSGPVILPFGEGKSIYNGKNRTFFSVAYEFDRLKDTTIIDAYVPVVANSRYPLSTPTGSGLYCDNSNSAACTGANPTAGYVSPYYKDFSTPSKNHIFTARLDHKITENNDFTFGWQLGRKNNRRQQGTTVTKLEDAFQAKNSDTDALNFTDNHVFGARAVNQFRMQWSVLEPSFETPNPDDPVVLISYRDPVSNSVRTLTAGNSSASSFSSSGSTINFPDSRKETRWQFQDSFTYLVGNHSIKSGFDVQKVNSKTVGLGDTTGTYNFGSVLNYSNNVLSRFRQNYGTASDVNNTYWGIFLNDEMKLFPTVTLSYGIRYERETAIKDNNNFGPRLGVAWDPFKSGKGVVRFGAGMFYNRVLLRTVGDSIQNQNSNLVTFDSNSIGTAATDVRRVAVLARIAQQFPVAYSSITDLKSAVTAACASIVTTLTCNANTGFVTNVTSAGNPLRSVDANLKIPESYQFNVGFEREVFKGFVFEANYTWNKTAHLWRDTNSNVPVLPAGYATWTDYLVANPFVYTVAGATTPTTRTYRFYLGSTGDGSGTATTQGGTTSCATTGTVTCFVNLNTTNTGTTAPSIAVTGSSTNSVGNPVGIALAAIAKFRPDQTVEETSVIRSIGNAKYQGLILEFRSNYRKLGQGFASSFRFNYTLSSTKDDGTNNTTNAEVNGDFSREFARNLQDRRHRIALSGTFDTPFWLGKLRFSPLFRYGSSAPFNLGAGGTDRNLDDLGTDRINFSGNIADIVYRKPGSAFPTALAAQFSLQPIGSKSGNLVRNAGTGPSFYTFDLSVSRDFKLSERMRFRPTAQFDNILNAAVFNYGAEFIDFTALRNDGTAPSATALAAFNNLLIPTRTYRQRQIRLGFRLDF